MSTAADWVEELRAFAVRFSGYGVSPDLAGLTLAQAWGVYRFFLRLATEG
jgi:hypothetical protein